MTGKRWLSVLMLFLCCFTGVFAQKESDQKAADAAKEKLRRQTVLIDSLIADARELRLPENRAFVLSRVAYRLWDIDQKRASDLFRDAVNELLAAQAAAETARKAGQQNELLTGQSTRPQLLQTIAGRDAEFALQSLYKTRPAAIERAMANRAAKADPKIRSTGNNDQYLAQAENNLEQTLLRQAAEQSPSRAVELLTAALKNGLSNETLSLLKRLAEKDPAAAAEFAGGVVSQLSHKTFTIANQPDYQNIQVALSLLNDFIAARQPADKQIKFDPSQMRSLADKLIAYSLDSPTGQYGYNISPSLVPIAEKLSPSSVERLKESGKALPHQGRFGGIYQDEGLSKLMNGETPVEQMIAEGSKLRPEVRGQVMQNAANRLMAAGNVDGARALLNDNFSDEALENALLSFNSSYSYQLIAQGKYSEAEALIDQLPDANRISGMINLAYSAFNSDPVKNRPFAAATLDKTRNEMTPQPETNTDMGQMMQLIAAYSKIEPSEGFRMFDGLIQQINEITEAAAVVSAFQGGYNVRQGEMIVSQGTSSGVYIDTAIFRNLAESDFDRTLNTISAFSRREIRITLKQQLLEGM